MESGTGTWAGRLGGVACPKWASLVLSIDTVFTLGLQVQWQNMGGPVALQRSRIGYHSGFLF